LFAIQLGGRMYNRADEFVIAGASALSGVTPYALARKTSELCEMAAVQMLAVIMPVASELDAGNDRMALRKLYVGASRLALATVMPMATVAIVMGSDILRLWVGPQYARHSPLVTLLAVAAVLMTSQRPAVEVLQGMARHRMIAVTSVVAGIVNVLLSIMLVRRFGLIGVAVGTLVPSAAMALGIVAPLANHRLEVSARAALRDIWAPALIPSIPSAALLWSLHRTVAAPSVIVLLAWTAAAMVVYGVGYMSMPASRTERRLLTD